MAKKDKNKSRNGDPAAPRQEIDAVKGFIVVMLVLIAALGVFIIITRNQLGEYDRALANSKNQAKKLGADATRVQGYLKLIKGSGETILMNYPEQFFENIYRGGEINIKPNQVRLEPRKKKQVRDGKYTEISWELEIKSLDRRQATLFLHGVESSSPTAEAIEVSMALKRGKDATPDTWDGTFKVGYRIAGLAR